jgi:hypothetical protein
MGQPDILKQGHGETTFFLVYGAEAIIPPRSHRATPPRVQAYDEATLN